VRAVRAGNTFALQWVWLERFRVSCVWDAAWASDFPSRPLLAAAPFQRVRHPPVSWPGGVPVYLTKTLSAGR
jgi:hypothetical protein